MISYLTTLFLGTPPGGKFSSIKSPMILSPVNDNFLFLNQRKNFFPRKNVPDIRDYLRAVHLRNRHATDRATLHKSML